jgi:RHS repeat-associated protein
VDQLLAVEDVQYSNDLPETADVLWAFTDNQNTVRELFGYNAATGTNQVLQSFQYNPYGQLVSFSAGTTTANANLSALSASYQSLVCYAGHFLDSETGLYYADARYYQAGCGRFTTQDPFGFDAGTTNLYEYCGDDPMDGTDPSGCAPGMYPITDQDGKWVPSADTLSLLPEAIDRDNLAYAYGVITNQQNSNRLGRERHVNIVAGQVVSSIEEIGSVNFPNAQRQALLNSVAADMWDYNMSFVYGNWGRVEQGNWRVGIARNANEESQILLSNADFDSSSVGRPNIRELQYQGLVPMGLSWSGSPYYNGDLLLGQSCIGCHSVATYGTDVVPAASVSAFQSFQRASVAIRDIENIALMAASFKSIHSFGGGAATSGEYGRFIGQGFTPAQAEYLAQEYQGVGHHFPITQATARNWGLPNWVRDNPFNVLSPSGITRGGFYELHYQVDPNFFAANFPARIGGTWNGADLGLQKFGAVGQAWYGTPMPLRAAGGTVVVGGGAAGAYWLFGNRGQQ